jgi:putative phosphoesterase
MKIAVISDIHDNVWKLEVALKKIRALEPHALICCGDLCSPFIVDLLIHKERGFTGPIHIVFGNNDGDRSIITKKAAASSGHAQVYGEFAEFLLVESETKLVERAALKKEHNNVDVFFDRSIQGKRIALNHYDYLARPIAASGKYSIVFYGHNHCHRHEQSDQTDVINPGAIMGYNGPDLKDIPSTFVIYDTAGDKTLRWYEIVTSVEDCLVQHSVHEYNKVTPETFAL